MNNEPVAWMDYLEHSDLYDLNVSGRGIPLYTHPAKTLTDEEDTECQYCKQGCIRCDARKLLTDEEIRQIAVECGVYINEQGSIYPDDICIYSFAKAILRKTQK